MPPPNVPGPLAEWTQRALALIIDAAVLWIPLIVVYVFGAVIGGAIGVLLILIGWLYLLAGSIFFAIQVGNTGASPGMRLVGLKCISLQTGQPIGAGMGVVRAIAHFVDGIICYVGWLWPLWDAQKQTLADKIMKTVVITAPKQAFSISPPT
jgi:uncharacterized RDD family membrane protein YckC